MLEIKCWHREVVRRALAIDTCDQEIIAYQASTSGVRGEMVRDLMLACVERRFNARRTRPLCSGSPTTAPLTEPVKP